MNIEHMLLKYKSPIGSIYCIFNGSELIEISIGERPFTPSPLHPKAYRLKPNLQPKAFSLFFSLFNELDSYFNGDSKQFNQEIKFIKGTDFQHKVWLALKEIPYGETRSYKWIAEKVGSPKATRAVAQALKKNPLPIILPCHRVIASDGSIGGYSWGIETKKWLLRHEGVLRHS
ncbi:hypothetical protein JZK55_04930 [Dissulfurispira thermophila]|uniref:Methylated-DNA--protein-cysteine methyltransferase n=2 Tax=root TaxID=1 RepID=A0A7G1H0E9_9BACT|nr:methylated-DNA--[protein]-cysteine S-methyltransferase [Dissulfurispira thermophila]BCB95571.1 hypothetical protein JZK55_04930 [Dissulfurispira thermophila]